MICPFCNKEAEWCENKAIYGRNYGKSFMCYYCKDCDAYVGCHNNTRKPLGTMANKELREWRRKTHYHIDPIWKEGKMPRKSFYGFISKILGFEFHVGEADIELCKKVCSMSFNID